MIQTSPHIAETFLTLAEEKISAIRRALSECGDMTLAAYVKALIPAPKPSYQPRTDMLTIVQRYTASLFGEALGRQAARDLEAFPAALTSNHLGVEYYAQSLQSSLLFSLNAMSGHAPHTVALFSCGNISLNNLTYPRGALIYHVQPHEINQSPLKLPVFSSRSRMKIVSATAPFNENMIRDAQLRLDRLHQDQQIPAVIAKTLNMVFEQDYLADEALACPSYSCQSTVINRRIWKRLFAEPDSAPELICLELEKITAGLVLLDLTQPESLLWRVLFDPLIRNSILEQLNGESACWTIETGTSSPASESPQTSSPPMINSGTMFFWGVSEDGKRIPLSLASDTVQGQRLWGRDHHRQQLECPYQAEAIGDAIQRGHLLPSLFTCYLTIGLARGIACVGGYFQESYLPRIQQAIVSALNNAGDSKAAELVSQVPTHCYLSGMLAVMANLEGVGLIPAGPTEMIASGGITPQDLERLRKLTIREAHLAGLFETAPDVIPPHIVETDWKQALAADSACLLAGKIVVK